MPESPPSSHAAPARPGPEPRVLVPQQLQPAALVLGHAPHAVAGRSMGTRWRVDWVGPRHSDTGAVQRSLQAALDELVRQMSTWDPASELCAYGRAPAGSWHPVSPDFFKVMQAALVVAQQSQGAFDPTVAPAVDHWGFGPDGPHGRHDEPEFVAPSQGPIPVSHWQALRLDPLRQAIFQPGGCRLDLSAIAKGHGVDVMAQVMRQRGVHSFLVELGGELRGEGHKLNGQPWWVALEQPPSASSSAASAPVGAETDDAPSAAHPPLPTTLVALHGLSVATSGDYRRAYRAGGRHHSHTIDPRDGQPVAHGLASVSVLHADAMWADAYATALTVLGPRAGPAWADSQQLAALFVERLDDGRYREQLSPALQELMT